MEVQNERSLQVSDLTDLGFNAEQVKPLDSFEAIPAGEYPAILIKSERKKTASGAGELLELQFQILSGQYQNRRLFTRINIRNPSDKAQQIGWSQLSSLARAVDVMSPKSSEELHDKPLVIVVKVRDDQQYGKQNEIVNYKHRHAGANRPSNVQAPATPGEPVAMDPFGTGPTPPGTGAYQQPAPQTVAANGKAW